MGLTVNKIKGFECKTETHTQEHTRSQAQVTMILPALINTRYVMYCTVKCVQLLRQDLQDLIFPFSFLDLDPCNR